MKKQVFVVEGHHDAAKLKEVLGDVNVVVTNGSDIAEQTIKLIKTLDQTHDIIIFTDPDYAGERIRKFVAKDLEHVYHAFLSRDVARSKNQKKIGIEHANKKDILDALSHMSLATHEHQSDVDHSFLYDCGLIGHEYSQKRRDELSLKFNLGQVNGKTLLKRLHLFGINQKDVKEVIDESST